MARSIALPILFASFGALASSATAEAQVRSISPSQASGTALTGAGGPSVVSPGQSSTIIGGPPGPSVGRIQPSLLTPPAIEFGPAGPASPPRMQPGTNLPVVRPLRPDAREPGPDRDAPHPEGITLDEAVARLIHDNLDLRARFSEISQADSDVLTASLRTNPIVFGDTQMIPYGSYSNRVAGGPTQFDVNIVYPLDVSHKRQARIRAAVVARQFVEASYRDAVRLAVDNLYGAYVDALMAQRQYERAIGKRKDLLSVVPVDEPAQALRDAQRKLALLINLPAAEVSRRQLEGRLDLPGDEEKLPPAPESVRIALEERPDLAAQRLAVCLADANLKAVLANRLDDVLLLYQPFTLQNGAPFDQKNGVSWAIGVTIPMPIYNRQQGNIRKARQIAEQARIRLAAMEQAVASDVQGAYLEHESAHQAWIRTSDEFQRFNTRSVRPSQDLDVDDPLRKKLEILEEQFQDLRDDSLIDKLNKSYMAVIRHRKSQLRINTVTGARIVP